MRSNDKILAVATVLTTVLSCYLYSKGGKKERQPRRWWTRPWILRRDNERTGSINTLQHEIRLENKEAYKRFIRMIEPQFNYILREIKPLIERKNTNMRAAIDPTTRYAPLRTIESSNRLAITLRYLATGDSFQSMELSTRVPHNTISLIVTDTCEAIRKKLGPKFLKPPNTRDEWEKKAKEFENIWGMPNCAAAMDGKHFAWKPPEHERAIWYCYKGFCSMVLLVLVDAKKKFLLVDIGANGRQSDAGVFARSDLNKAIAENSLKFPPPKQLPGRRLRVPYVIVADNAFPLRKNIMIPFTFHGLTESQLYYNKGISRARNVVENAFGILANRFRVFLAPIELRKAKSVKLIIETCCILHNFLMEHGPREYAEDNPEQAPLPPLERERSLRNIGSSVRMEFLSFFNMLFG